jgi:hypothetical protein
VAQNNCSTLLDSASMPSSSSSPRLGLFVLIAALAFTASAGPSARRGGKSRKGKNRCGVPSCKRCNRTNKTACEDCFIGYALTEDMQCGACGDGCRSCKLPGTCDICKLGFTKSPISGQCEPCAKSCHRCNSAGPGGCDECRDRHTLHVHLDPHGEGEVHTCVHCGPGCAKCEMGDSDGAAHCLSCDYFYAALPHGEGCSFSFIRVLMVMAIAFILIFACVYACSVAEDGGSLWGEDDPRLARRRHEQRRMDRAEVIQKSDGASVGLRGRHQTTPRVEEITPAFGASAHGIIGYS